MATKDHKEHKEKGLNNDYARSTVHPSTGCYFGSFFKDRTGNLKASLNVNPLHFDL
jgi:hypothetical protein